MGFDPDECPPEVVNEAVHLCDQYRESTLFELLPIFGKRKQENPLKPIQEFVDAAGGAWKT